MGDKEKQELWAELGLDDSSVEELEMEAGPSTTSTGSAGKGIISNNKKDMVDNKPSRSKTKSKNGMATKNNKRPANKSGALSINAHDKGDNVYAAWWSQDLDRNSAPDLLAGLLLFLVAIPFLDLVLDLEGLLSTISFLLLDIIPLPADPVEVVEGPASISSSSTLESSNPNSAHNSCFSLSPMLDNFLDEVTTLCLLLLDLEATLSAFPDVPNLDVPFPSIVVDDNIDIYYRPLFTK